MDVLDVYYVGGFGVMGWVAASDYSQAQSDPLAEHKSDIMQHMNADHKDALILLAKRFAGIEAQEAEMTSVDRLGFHLRLKTQDGVKGTRVAFLREVSEPVTNQRSVRRDGEAGASRVNHLVAGSISARLEAKANSVDCGRGASRCVKPTRRHHRGVEVLRVR